MSLFRVFDVAGSALTAQSHRLNATASNLANADSVASSNGEPYRARHVMFTAAATGTEGATGVQVAGAGRSPEEANDPRIETEASEIARDCISRSRVMRQAPAGMKPTEEDIQQRIAACRADKTFDPLAVAASLRGYKDQAVTAEQMAAVKVPTLGIVGTLDHTLKAMQQLKTLRPSMKLVLLEGISHTGKTGIQGTPALVSEIRTFIAEQRQAKTY